MALKRKIGSTEFDSLNESLKGEYKKNESDGMFYLEVDDAHELINALERVREENKGNKELATSLTQQINAVKEELARKNGDVTALENSWKEREKKREKEHEQEKAMLKKIASQGAVNDALDPIAQKFKVPSVMKKILAERIHVDFTENGTEVRVLDKDGKPSALTIAEFEKEILENEEFKSILVQSRASGSTANSGKSYSGSAENHEKRWSELSPTEKVERLKTRKEQR